MYVISENEKICDQRHLSKTFSFPAESLSYTGARKKTYKSRDQSPIEVNEMKPKVKIKKHLEEKQKIKGNNESIPDIFRRLNEKKINDSKEENRYEMVYPEIRATESENSRPMGKENPELHEERKLVGVDGKIELKKEENKKIGGMRENWLSKLQVERKLKEKIKIEDKKKIKRKKIGLEIIDENGTSESLPGKKDNELRKMFEAMKKKENLEGEKRKKIFTPKKATPKNKRLGMSPGLGKKTVREMVHKIENFPKEN